MNNTRVAQHIRQTLAGWAANPPAVASALKAVQAWQQQAGSDPHLDRAAEILASYGGLVAGSVKAARPINPTPDDLRGMNADLAHVLRACQFALASPSVKAVHVIGLAVDAVDWHDAVPVDVAAHLAATADEYLPVAQDAAANNDIVAARGAVRVVAETTTSVVRDINAAAACKSVPMLAFLALASAAREMQVSESVPARPRLV